MKDFRGVEIEVGHLIAHASRYSSSMWLCKAEVIEVYDDYIIVNKYKTDYKGNPVKTRNSKLIQPSYIAVLERK